MSLHVNANCYLCVANHYRNEDNNYEMLESVTDSTIVIDGVLHQHHSRGAKAFEIVSSTGQVYAPHITEDQYMALSTNPSPLRFDTFTGRLSHMLIHMRTGSVMAIPTVDGVMLIRLVSDPLTGAMIGRSVFSFSGSTAPYCGGAEGADTLLHVDGVLERPGSTQPFHTVHRSIEVIGYLSPGSSTYVRIINTQQVTTTVKMLASRTDIKLTLAEAMASASASAVPIGPGPGPGAVSSNSAASSHPTLDEATAHLVCECYSTDKSLLVAKLLATAYRLHGSDLMDTLSECKCAICTNRIGQCVECFGALMREEEEECV